MKKTIHVLMLALFVSCVDPSTTAKENTNPPPANPGPALPVLPDLSSHGVQCTSSDLTGYTYPLNYIHCGKMTIDAPIDLSANDQRDPIVIYAEIVDIAANINLDGEDGVTATDGNVLGGRGGQGSTSNGGGISGNYAESGSGFTTQDGQVGTISALCGNGGSGAGGFWNDGEDGKPCSSNDTAISVGGEKWLSFPYFFEGGFGGGAGAERFSNGSFDLGLGGGGGGSFNVFASKYIVIRPGVTISARGGKGGNSIALGGAGGGGSGGLIWLKADLDLWNFGMVNVSGGAGGINTGSGPDTGGDGGNGGNGVFRTEVAGIITDQ